MNELSRLTAIREDKSANTFRVPRAAFVSPAVLQAERERIFDRCWLYLGHASEISKPGQFITRIVAGRTLIFNRNRKGEVRAFLNTCPHRGATVCREKSGTTKHFQCLYHGWVFDDNGKIADQPGGDAYDKEFCERGDADLKAPPRLEEYRGLYFICFDEDVVDLATYLGHAREYIDLIMDQSESGMAILGGTQEYSIKANWKLLVENSIDGYHAAMTHATYMDYLKSTAGALAASGVAGAGVDLGNGHAVIEYSAPWGRPIGQWVPLWGEATKADIERIIAGLTERHGEERAKRIALKNRNLLIFPNLIINDIMAITVRTFYPLAPDLLHVNAWALAPSEETAAARKNRLESFLEFIGPGGFATPDDVEALQSCQSGFSNADQVPWNDISRGMGRPSPMADDEEQMRGFWRGWNARMNADVGSAG